MLTLCTTTKRTERERETEKKHCHLTRIDGQKVHAMKNKSSICFLRAYASACHCEVYCVVCGFCLWNSQMPCETYERSAISAILCVCLACLLLSSCVQQLHLAVFPFVVVVHSLRDRTFFWFVVWSFYECVCMVNKFEEINKSKCIRLIEHRENIRTSKNKTRNEYLRCGRSAGKMRKKNYAYNWISVGILLVVHTGKQTSTHILIHFWVSLVY